MRPNWATPGSVWTKWRRLISWRTHHWLHHGVCIARTV